jgi:hypothetical protein
VIRAGIGGTGLWQLTGEEIGRYVLSSVIPFLFFWGDLVEPRVWISSQSLETNICSRVIEEQILLFAL